MPYIVKCCPKQTYVLTHDMLTKNLDFTCGDCGKRFVYVKKCVVVDCGKLFFQKHGSKIPLCNYHKKNGHVPPQPKSIQPSIQPSIPSTPTVSFVRSMPVRNISKAEVVCGGYIDHDLAMDGEMGTYPNEDVLGWCPLTQSQRYALKSPPPPPHHQRYDSDCEYSGDDMRQGQHRHRTSSSSDYYD